MIIKVKENSFRMRCCLFVIREVQKIAVSLDSRFKQMKFFNKHNLTTNALRNLYAQQQSLQPPIMLDIF
jgi:CRISPR/Cas system CSM-associated protein Csm2 small subunit